MIFRLVRLLLTVLAALVGYTFTNSLTSIWFHSMPLHIRWAITGLGTIVAGLVGLSISPVLISSVVQGAKWLESRLNKIPTSEIVGGTIGVIFGLIIATLLGASLYRLPYLGPYLPITINLILGYLGWSFGTKKKEEILSAFSFFQRIGGKEKNISKTDARHNYKILDTSVIIDGRIADIVKSGFIDGTLIIPGFVLEELRHIADSTDLLKRNRGRRGLDILNKVRRDQDVQVRIYERDYEDLNEVDTKLVRLAQELVSPVITNDYNLNKVAELQGVKVLNINELANAIKPIVLPGEEMQVQVIKDGKEIGQGVGYLDDGTMIVVENGKRYIGQTIPVLVTSVLQTAAGRMIFARPKGNDKRQGNPHHHPVERGEYQWMT